MNAVFQSTQAELLRIEAAILKHDTLEMVRLTNGMPCKTMTDIKLIMNELGKVDRASAKTVKAAEASDDDEVKDICAEALDILENQKKRLALKCTKVLDGASIASTHAGKVSLTSIAMITGTVVSGTFAIKYFMGREL